jgi:alpha-L-fucosidase 2
MGPFSVCLLRGTIAVLAMLLGLERELALSGEPWRIDPAEAVTRNDVLYTTPSAEPWEAMPTGGGDLSAMVRWDGSLHLHLTKSDCWGFQARPDAPQGTRFFNNTSPGHVRLDFGVRGKEAASRYFRQRLDLYHGRVVIQLGDERSGPRLEVWGHPTRKVLVIAVTDPAKTLDAANVELSEWRPTMQVGTSGGGVHAREVHERPARPHLANTGMEGFFGPDRDPLRGRGTAVIVSSPVVAPSACAASGSTARLVLPHGRPASFHILVAAAVTPSGDPLAAARREMDEAVRAGLAALEAEHQAWWRDYWGRSMLRVTSPDKTADRLCAAYHVHLYTLGCVNRGPYPAKWDGGPGLMRGDERNWGLSEWVQEIRFTYLPLYAANRLEMARGLSRHYSRMMPYLETQTRKMWGLPGVWIPETVLPWGHAEDFLLAAGAPGTFMSYFVRRAADKVPYGRFDVYNPYIGFLFTAGLEICQHELLYNRYSGDEEFLRRDAYPVIRAVCQFVAALMCKEGDGRYHLDPANALETWWLVRDPADTMAGVRAVFPEFVRLSQQYGQDAELRGQCAAILAAMPEPARGFWDAAGKIHPEVDVYAPAVARGPSHPRINSENPALYRVFPFGLSGIGSPDYALACRTFERRICPIEHGWSMDALWAARLGLGDQACALAARHAERFQRFRYGGWTSNDSRVFPGGLSAAPFLDAGGLSAAAIQEILLQSDSGVLRIAPAVAKNWSGSFRLRAEGGFLVAAVFRDGKVRAAEIQSLFGRPCVLANPWPGTCVVRHGGSVIIQAAGPTVRFDTTRGEVYLVEPR